MQMPKTGLWLVAGVLAAAALGGCTTLNVTSDVNARTSIASCHTYAWRAERRASGPHAAEANPVNAARLHAAIDTGLQAHGLRPAADHAEADCLVSFTVGVRQKIAGMNTSPYWGGGWGWGWGGGPWGPWGWDEPMVIHQGIIAVDLSDARTHQPIWHASVNQDITSLTGVAAETAVNAAVTALFSHFPGAGSTTTAGATAAL